MVENASMDGRDEITLPKPSTVSKPPVAEIRDTLAAEADAEPV